MLFREAPTTRAHTEAAGNWLQATDRAFQCAPHDLDAGFDHDPKRIPVRVFVDREATGFGTTRHVLAGPLPGECSTLEHTGSTGQNGGSQPKS